MLIIKPFSRPKFDGHYGPWQQLTLTIFDPLARGRSWFEMRWELKQHRAWGLLAIVSLHVAVVNIPSLCSAYAGIIESLNACHKVDWASELIWVHWIETGDGKASISGGNLALTTAGNLFMSSTCCGKKLISWKSHTKVISRRTTWAHLTHLTPHMWHHIPA